MCEVFYRCDFHYCVQKERLFEARGLLEQIVSWFLLSGENARIWPDVNSRTIQPAVPKNLLNIQKQNINREPKESLILGLGTSSLTVEIIYRECCIVL